jgi:benzylsuccinate CoA-transferase BbsF subunit
MNEQAAPLAGIRVVDFGHVWAGPYCAATLADMGAEVIKVESEKRLDVHRNQGPYPDNLPGINRSGVFNAQNRNKKSVNLNLTDVDDLAIAKRLVAESDVVVENFSPRVMKKLGLDYASLCAVKPDIIMASLSAFGQEGPQSQYVGYGPSLDAWSGLCSLNRYPNDVPLALGGMFPDTTSALYACFAILIALRERDEKGLGCHIDLSELETAVLLLADLLVRFPGESIPQDWVGNADPYSVPLGAYPCAGEDQWIIVAVEDEEAWAGLCAVLARPEWVDDAEFATSALRKRRLELIEDALSSWTRSRSADAAFKELQAHGVPAGRALNVAELLEDEQLRAREFFRNVKHPEMGEQTIYAPIWRFDGVSGDVRPAPLLGQDTESVLSMIRAMKL